MKTFTTSLKDVPEGDFFLARAVDVLCDDKIAECKRCKCGGRCETITDEEVYSLIKRTKSYLYNKAKDYVFYKKYGGKPCNISGNVRMFISTLEFLSKNKKRCFFKNFKSEIIAVVGLG